VQILMTALLEKLMVSSLTEAIASKVSCVT
jgi:hypothetical protein